MTPAFNYYICKAKKKKKKPFDCLLVGAKILLFTKSQNHLKTVVVGNRSLNNKGIGV